MHLLIFTTKEIEPMTLVITESGLASLADERRGCDPAPLGSTPPVRCGKICGSIGCKRDIRTQECVGVSLNTCSAQKEKSPEDRLQALAWITGGSGNMSWLYKPDSREKRDPKALPSRRLRKDPPAVTDARIRPRGEINHLARWY